jgi:hypothetical protein
MRKHTGDEYNCYTDRVPFMVPLPKFLSKAIASPMNLAIRKEYPCNGRELLIILFIYTVSIMILSFPFVLLDWPPSGWANWPIFTSCCNNLV